MLHWMLADPQVCRKENGVYLVLFICPRCSSCAKAPLSAVAPGDAGIWVCDACGTAYQIDIEFSCVEVPRSVSQSPPAIHPEAGERADCSAIC